MTPPSSPEIQGKDWTREVGSINDSKERIRSEFYKKRAELKLAVGDIEDVLKDPNSKGFKTLKELETGPAFKEVKVKSGDSLFKILDTYFRGQGASESQKETYLSLYYLNTQKVNVDYLLVGETVKIEKGRLTILKADGAARVQDALLRPEVVTSVPPAPAPVPPAPAPEPPAPAPEPPAPAPEPPAPAPEPPAPAPEPPAPAAGSTPIGGSRIPTPTP